MRMKNFLSFMLVFFTISYASAQDDLLNQLDAEKPVEKQVQSNAFKALQICNMQSTKLPAKGEWYILISHRFADLTQGFDNFFGLDNALTKIGGIYAPTNWLSLGVSRQTHDKTYELTGKYKLANQIESGFPVTIVGYNTMNFQDALKNTQYPDLKTVHKLAFTTQLLISRKFTERFSLEVAPIYVHKNLYDANLEQKDQYLIASGARYKITKRMSLNLEYAARIGMPEGFTSPYQNPLSVGWDIETGGHVFQLVVSNSQPMDDVTVFSGSNSSLVGNGGSLYFGFNMYRVF